MSELFSAMVYIFMNLSVGNATVFYSNDLSNPNPNLACYNRDLDDEKDLMVAHKTLPCKSKVLLVNLRNGKSVVARIGDRGPARSLVDLTALTAKILKHNGKEPVILLPLKD